MTENFSFTNRFIEFANDGVLNKKELEDLKTIANDPQIKDKYVANHVLKDLDSFNKTTNVEYSLTDDKGVFRNVKFKYTPSYNELDKVYGRNNFEKIANISQSDALPETLNDGNRCAASSLLNSYIYQGGDFAKLAQKLGVEQDFTFKNVHLLQEKIYTTANKEGEGLSTGLSYSYNPITKKITKAEVTGEIVEAARSVGLEIIPLNGSNVNTLNQRKEKVDEFFAKYPNASLQIGIHLDTSSGDLYSVNQQYPENHAVTIVKKDNEFYLVDTGQINNGANDNATKLTPNQMQAFVYSTSANVNGIFLNSY
ncbi:MAG: hypothetical protein U0457_17310 [Candidatus Sericytochromatia bacterium]